MERVVRVKYGGAVEKIVRVSREEEEEWEDLGGGGWKILNIIYRR